MSSQSNQELNSNLNQTQLNCDFTIEEAKHLLSVMIKAKEFDAQEAALQIIEGQLFKYTNVMKGWQYRWFVLNPARGTLEYYLLEERKKSHPRGCVFLAGCVVSPSEEDSQTFIVSASCGEAYKLKANDAKERQFWVDKLRQVGLAHENRIASQQHHLLSPSNRSASRYLMSHRSSNDPSIEAVRDILVQTQKHQRKLVDAIEKFTCNDKHLLMVKATSQAMVNSLEQCFVILQSISASTLTIR